jgi:hypothetical protein
VPLAMSYLANASNVRIDQSTFESRSSSCAWFVSTSQSAYPVCATGPSRSPVAAE